MLSSIKYTLTSGAIRLSQVFDLETPNSSNSRKMRCVLCLLVWMVSKLESVCRAVCTWCLSSTGNRNIRFPLCAQCVLSVSSMFSCHQHKAALRQSSMPLRSFHQRVLWAAHRVQILLDRFYLTSGHLLVLTGNTLTP